MAFDALHHVPELLGVHASYLESSYRCPYFARRLTARLAPHRAQACAVQLSGQSEEHRPIATANNFDMIINQVRVENHG
jgi:hypothetical protein